MFWPYSAYYTARIGRNANTNCVYSGDEDTADHTVFHSLDGRLRGHVPNPHSRLG